MKMVYRITPDVNNYQFFLTANPDDYRKLNALCQPLKELWEPPEVFIYQPFLKKGDFYQFDSGCMILSPKATSLIEDFFLDFGEVLPLPYKGEVYSFINILACYDCLDEHKTRWRPGFEGLLIDKYAFHPERLPFEGPFKIPQTYTSEILAYINTDSGDQDNLIAIVEKYNLEGLIFEKLWQEEQD